MTRFAVLGLGEAGSAIAADLAAAEGVEVRGYDPADVAAPDGVQRHDDPAKAVADAAVVLAVTTAAHAAAALEEVVAALPPGAIYADLSTASPALERQLAATVAARSSGAGFADVALMAPVPGRGLRTPALVSGPAAEAFAAVMAPLGMPVEVTSTQAGDAATRKLLRSVVMKGLAQLLIESLDAAEAAGLAAETWDHLVAQLTSVDEALVRRLVTDTRQHALRRLHEMEATIDLLDELGVDATMSRATAARLREAADHDTSCPTPRTSVTTRASPPQKG